MYLWISSPWNFSTKFLWKITKVDKYRGKEQDEGSSRKRCQVRKCTVSSLQLLSFPCCSSIWCVSFRWACRWRFWMSGLLILLPSFLQISMFKFSNFAHFLTLGNDGPKTTVSWSRCDSTINSRDFSIILSTSPLLDDFMNFLLCLNSKPLSRKGIRFRTPSPSPKSFFPLEYSFSSSIDQISIAPLSPFRTVCL